MCQGCEDRGKIESRDRQVVTVEIDPVALTLSKFLSQSMLISSSIK